MERFKPTQKQVEQAQSLGGFTPEDIEPPVLDPHYADKGGHFERSEANKLSRRELLKGLMAFGALPLTWEVQVGEQCTVEDQVQCYEEMTTEEQMKQLELGLFMVSLRMNYIQEQINHIYDTGAMPENKGEL